MIEWKWFNQKIQSMNSVKSNCRCDAEHAFDISFVVLPWHKCSARFTNTNSSAKQCFGFVLFYICGKFTETLTKKNWIFWIIKPFAIGTFGEFQSAYCHSYATFTRVSCTNAKRQRSQYQWNRSISQRVRNKSTFCRFSKVVFFFSYRIQTGASSCTLFCSHIHFVFTSTDTFSY